MNKIEKFIVDSICNKPGIPKKLRIKLYNICGLKVSLKSCIRESVYFNSEKIFINGDAFINRDCKFYSSLSNYGGGSIIIESGVSIGFNTVLCCISHEIGTDKHRNGKHIDKDIIIKEGTWIGANVIVLPGVTIEKGCVIGAGSVVVESTEPNGLYVGNPAIKIQTL